MLGFFLTPIFWVMFCFCALLSQTLAQSNYEYKKYIEENYDNNSSKKGTNNNSGLLITLTANISPTSIEHSASAVTIITKEEIQKSNPSSVADILRGVPGLSLVENGGFGSVLSVRLRGSNTGQTLVIIDGVRVNDPSTGSGEFDFSIIPPALIERIEVLRGPQTALYGSDAMGGVVHIFTKKGQGRLTYFLQGEGGSYGTFGASTGVYGTNDALNYAIGVSSAKSEGFSRYGYRISRLNGGRSYENDGFVRNAGYARLGYAPGKGVKIEASSFISGLQSEYDAAFGAKPDSPSKTRNLFYLNSVKGEVDSFNSQLKQIFTISTSRMSRDLRSVSAFDFGGITDYDSKYRYIGSRVEGEYRTELKVPKAGMLMLGAKLERETIESYSMDFLPFFRQENKDIDKGQNTRSLFALWQLPIGERIDLSLSGRIDDIPSSVTLRTWRASASYRILETDTKLRTSLGTGGKAPTLYQLYDTYYGNKMLKSEHSSGGDVGIDQQLFAGRVKFSISAFYNRLSNMIDSDPISWQYLNIAKAKTRGIETAFSATIIPEILKFQGTYTYLKAKDEKTGLELARRPTHNAKLSLAFSFYKDWIIEPSLTLVSKRFSSANETDRLAPYARMDALLTWKVKENVELYLRGENLTNAHYQEIYNYGTTGRAIYSGFRSTW